MHRHQVLGMATAVAAVMAFATPAEAQRVVLGANPPGSLFHALGSGLATVITKHSPLRVEIFPEGQTAFFPMFATGEVDLGMVNPVGAGVAYRAEPPYDELTGGRGIDMRTLMAGTPMELSMIVRKDSGIETMKDLAGRRVVTDYGTFLASNLTVRAMLANAGLTVDDTRQVRVSNIVEGVRAVMEGRADSSTMATGMGVVTEFDAAHGARLLEASDTPEALRRVSEAAPGLTSIEVEPVYPGVERRMTMLSYPVTVVSRPDLSNEIVYQLLETTWEHYEELGEIHARLKAWIPERFATANVTSPYHPGAISFYRDKGVWTAEIEEAHRKVARD